MPINDRTRIRVGPRQFKKMLQKLYDSKAFGRLERREGKYVGTFDFYDESGTFRFRYFKDDNVFNPEHYIYVPDLGTTFVSRETLLF